MTKKNYSKYEAKEELVTLSFNHVLLHKKDTKIYQVIFLSLLNNSIYIKSILYETRLEIDYALLHKKSSLPSLLFYGKKDYYLCFYQEGRNNISMPQTEC